MQPDGREVWTLGGRLVYVDRKKPTETDIDSLAATLFPAGVQILTRSVTQGFDDSSLSFTVTGTRAWAKDNFLSFRQTIRVRIARSRRYFLSVDPSGDDERQDFARPVVEVTQTGTAEGQGGYPAFPAFLLPDADLDEPVTEIGELVVDPTDGKVVSGAIAWAYRGRVLNKVAAGQIADFTTVLQSPKSLEGEQSKAKGQTSSASVA
jgi:hypothetical protein